MRNNGHVKTNAKRYASILRRKRPASKNDDPVLESTSLTINKRCLRSNTDVNIKANCLPKENNSSVTAGTLTQNETATK